VRGNLAQRWRMGFWGKLPQGEKLVECESTMAVSSQATTEQLQIAQRLLEILSPYGVQTRTDMIERGGRFVHYTSAENGLKIINTKTIWMRNTNCMTDYSEVQHGDLTCSINSLQTLRKQASLRALSTDVLMALASSHLISLINGGTTYDLTPTLHASPSTMIPRISTVAFLCGVRSPAPLRAWL